MQPKISICVPTYEMNGLGVPFLQELLQTIQQQTYKNYEIIISDQSINDNIKDMIESNFSSEPITYLKVPDSIKRNASCNSNFAFEHATGDIIKPLFQDDFFFRRDCLEKIAESNTNWGACGFIHTNAMHSHFYNYQTPIYAEDTPIGRNKIGCPSVIFFKKELGIRFDEELIWLMDCELYYRLYKIDKPAILNESYVAIRIWNSVTKSINDSVKFKEADYVRSKYNLEFLDSHIMDIMDESK